ncbi:MAG TPA: type II toxin-antitoxin system PemK/MazF family toxin, partial [Paracoccaceae bacterium]|nr:type II toxin-antitoxin system PemK/MazF family toxin [Paracoccaceae bacterium]
PGDVVLVPFPYTERRALYKRPTLIVSARTIGSHWPLAWVLMITSAKNRSWPGDVDLLDRFADAGLLDPSVVRTAKITNVEFRDAHRIGRVPKDILDRVMAEIRANLGLTSG